jgi:hypothetical protein
MRTVFRYFLPVCFVVLFGSCSIQDHLVPEESNQCRVILKLFQLDKYLIQPNETVTIGQEVLGEGGYFTVNEILKFRGNSYAIGWKTADSRVGAAESSSSYEYDSEGRLKKSVDQIKRPTATITKVYDYVSPTELKITETQDYGHFPVPPSNTTSYTLDGQGLVIDPNVTYNSDGYVIQRGSISYNIVNGNDLGTATERYDYDITKLNPIPNPFPFYGKNDKNLRTGIVSLDTSIKVEYELVYIYDTDGRLKYDVLLIDYPDEDPRLRVHLNGYEWSCPK